MRTVAFDTETFYIKNQYSVQDLGNWRYTNDARFDCYLLSVYDGEDSWVGHPKDFNWESIDGATLLSHNRAFDQQVYNRLVELGIAPRVKIPEWHCTANFTSFLCNRRSLADASEHLLRVTVPKAMRDWMNGKTWADAVAAGKAPAMGKYALDDGIRCHQLWTRYQSHWSQFERDLSDLTIRQCARGVAIDVEKLDRYIVVLKETKFAIEKTMPWVVEDDAKVGSPKAIAEQCRRVGIPRPPVKSREGEEAFVRWFEAYSGQYKWVAAIGKHRTVGKVLSTLETIRERLRPDNTIDFSLLYFGAHTGRWSGGGSGLNLQNLRKDPIYILDDYDIIDDGRTYTPGEIIECKIREVIDVRSLFIPRPGHKFVISDLSQIEPRVLRWCAQDWEFLELVSKGYSPYEAAARTSPSIAWKGGDLKKENKALYQRVKINELGLGYGCGPNKFIALAKTLGGVDLTEEQSASEVSNWRESNPKIVKLWNKLDILYKKSCGKSFEMELPSGRVMRYPKVMQEYKSYEDPETGAWKRKAVITAEIGDRRKALYGGLLTENLVQATSRDVFGEHLLALDKAGIPVVFTVHDEAVTEVPTGADARDVQNIMSKTPEWLEGCPVAAEAIEATHYMK